MSSRLRWCIDALEDISETLQIAEVIRAKQFNVRVAKHERDRGLAWEKGGQVSRGKGQPLTLSRHWLETRPPRLARPGSAHHSLHLFHLIISQVPAIHGKSWAFDGGKKGRAGLKLCARYADEWKRN